MPIYRCLLIGGGQCLGGTNLDEARSRLESRMHSIAGFVAKPIRVKHKHESDKLYECYQLGEAKGVIISGYLDNPVEDFLT